ncbi:LytR C-terminal domain-containing protein [Streptomyces sp. NBS 14/10]|uniref:LytR C-terminal domain-containing protein n=1 Tax=Streptomyces sp. NBS 14/10 TaxID=1945643 RepID=UPI000B7CCF86|nr:LytR C-terminal domain-containing protein [Streptomyces sp. NBS 14/10]KAK1180948.1 LytR C-terminal domain-containing protein [Streptomyces sp. NBS 14/10]
MSMLTPPGMGGKYRITGNRYPRMRRPRGRRRLVFAAMGTVVALGLVGWGTLQLIDVFSGGDDDKTVRAARGTADCKREPAKGQGQNKADKADKTGKASRTAQQAPKSLPKPAEITVNVYNATPRTGLAKDTADELRKRGFKIGKVGNAPAAYDKKVKAPGILLGAPAATDGPFDVLATQLDGAQTKNDARSGKDVDLIIGTAFKDLVKEKDAVKAMAALATPKPSSSAPTC